MFVNLDRYLVADMDARKIIWIKSAMTDSLLHCPVETLGAVVVVRHPAIQFHLASNGPWRWVNRKSRKQLLVFVTLHRDNTIHGRCTPEHTKRLDVQPARIPNVALI